MSNTATVIKNIAANATTTGLITGFQLLSVPIFLHYWGITLYGEWIALNAISSYFQVADVGLNTATSNSLVDCYVARNYNRLNTLLTNNVVFIGVTFGLLLMTLNVAIRLDLGKVVMRTNVVTPDLIGVCLNLLLLQVFVGTLTNVCSGIFRATAMFSHGVMVDNAIRLCEYTVVLGGAVSGINLALILGIVLIVKCVGLLGKYYYAKNLFPFELKWASLDIKELQKMWAPSTSFLLFPIANAISLQGPVLVINFLLGGVAVVTFTTTRSMVNAGRSVLDILQRSVWPEMSLAFSRKDYELLRRLHRKTLVATTVIVSSIIATFLLIGKLTYLIWTGGKTPWDTVLFVTLLFAFFTNALWSSSGILLQSTNNHERMAVLCSVLSFCVLTLSYFILQTTKEIGWAPLALVIGDLATAIYVIRRAFQLTSDSWGNILVAALQRQTKRL